MGINVEVEQAIEGGKPFGVTLSVDDGEKQGKFEMTLTVKGVVRPFSLRVGTFPITPPLKVHDLNTWTVHDWGTGAVGDRVVVTLEEVGPGARKGEDKGAIVS